MVIEAQKSFLGVDIGKPKRVWAGETFIESRRLRSFTGVHYTYTDQVTILDSERIEIRSLNFPETLPRTISKPNGFPIEHQIPGFKTTFRYKPEK